MACEEAIESSEDSSSCYCLQLSDSIVTFEATSKSKLTNVFYDDTNTQVFSIHSGDVTEVIVKSPNENYCKRFKMDEKSHVISIKFSLDLQILAVQRTKVSVDFLTFEGDIVCREFSHEFKKPTTVLLGFVWTGKTEIVFVTDQGIKLCKVDVKSNTISALKTLNAPVNWYYYFSPSQLLLLNYGSKMQLCKIQQGHIIQSEEFVLKNLDLEGTSNVSRNRSSQGNVLADQDVVLGVIYNRPRVLVMNPDTGISSEVRVIVYTVTRSVKNTHILKINQNGRFALSIVDNLIIVHNQLTKSSMIFDITDAEFEGVEYLFPIAPPTTIKPPVHNPPVSSSTNQQRPCELYSPNWVLFQPNIVMDAKIGCLWYIEVNLFGFLHSIADKKELTCFLLSRSGAQFVIAKMLETLLNSRDKNMKTVGEIFDQINRVYREFLEVKMRRFESLPPSMLKRENDEVILSKTMIDQEFMYRNVFLKLDDRLHGKNLKESRFLTWVLLEYVRSLVDCQIEPVQPFLYELLIKSLVINNNFYQLHQLLQYHAISDSKPLACSILYLENLYPAARQLAIDMLERLGCAKEEITEILLSKQQLLSSLRYAQKNGTITRTSGTKYLDAALTLGDEKLFYTFLHYFNLKDELRAGKLVTVDGNQMFPPPST